MDRPPPGWRCDPPGPAGGRGVRAVSPRGHAKVRFMTDATHEGPPDWPLFGLRLTCGGVPLRPAREEDLPHLAAIQPDDYEHDPRAEVLPGLGVDQHRRRL